MTVFRFHLLEIQGTGIGIIQFSSLYSVRVDSVNDIAPYFITKGKSLSCFLC